jgi:hypothetical protein
MSAVFYCSQASPGGFFCYNKGVLMQKVSYMGNGSTTEFYFNFPYFETSNVVVTKNNQTATGYNIIGNSGGLDADIPYTGGKVVFETAPGTQDNITISRNLPLSRIADYQPTAKIEPTILNQDLNYLMEVIKDRKDELDELCTQYSEIADKESTTTLLARISAIHDEIIEIDAKITALGDISQIRGDIATNTNNITTLQSDVAAILTRSFNINYAQETPVSNDTIYYADKSYIAICEKGIGSEATLCVSKNSDMSSSVRIAEIFLSNIAGSVFFNIPTFIPKGYYYQATNMDTIKIYPITI